MDTKLQSPQPTLLSRRRLRSNPSRLSTLTRSHDIQSITKTSSISTFPSTTVLTSLEQFPRPEMSLKLPLSTGPLPDPFAQPSAPSLIPSSFPNPMTESSPSTPGVARRSVRCISPLNYAFLRWSLSTTRSCAINGKIASNPFFRRRGSGASKRTCVM